MCSLAGETPSLRLSSQLKGGVGHGFILSLTTTYLPGVFITDGRTCSWVLTCGINLIGCLLQKPTVQGQNGPQGWSSLTFYIIQV